jgi:hypothetical protein
MTASTFVLALLFGICIAASIEYLNHRACQRRILRADDFRLVCKIASHPRGWGADGGPWCNDRYYSLQVRGRAGWETARLINIDDLPMEEASRLYKDWQRMVEEGQ